MPKWVTKPAVWERLIEIFHEPVIDEDRSFIRRDFYPGNVLWFHRRDRVADEVEAGLSTLDAGGSTAQQLAAAMRTVLGAFDHMDLDDKGQTLADKLQIQARAVGHPLGAPSQRNDLIIASLAIRHRAPLISHNYRDSINIDALDLRTMAPIRRRPPRVRLEPDA